MKSNETPVDHVRSAIPERLSEAFRQDYCPKHSVKIIDRRKSF